MYIKTDETVILNSLVEQADIELAVYKHIQHTCNGLFKYLFIGTEAKHQHTVYYPQALHSSNCIKSATVH